MSSSRRPVVQVEGLKSLRRSMREAGVDIADLKEAHADVAQTVVRAAVFHPKHPERSTGKLQESVRGSGQQGAAVIRAGRASLPYTQPIHWGRPARHIAGQPFVWDAIEKSKEQWTGQYAVALQKIINNVEGAPGP